MKRSVLGLVLVACAGSAAQAVVVTPGNSSAPWIGFMNVFELPSNGGGFVFASGWGVPDLNASFNDAAPSVTMSPNTIGDPNPFWYTPSGGPGAAGNKIMEANLFIQNTGGFAGQTVTFEGFVLSNTFTAAHEAKIFIRDFAPDFSSFNETIVPATAGAFSISLNAINDTGRHVQYGFQVKGVNVWVTDTAPFGNVVFSSVPAAGSLPLLAAAGLLARRRRSR